MIDRPATWPELHDWINDLFGPNHQLTDIRPTFRDLHHMKTRGRWFPQPDLHGYEQMEPKMAFKNISDIVSTTPGLTYVQGLAAGKIGIVYPHAWATDAEGRCIELTWDMNNYDGDSRYYGVSFTRKQLSKLQLVRGKYDWYEGFAETLLLSSLVNKKESLKPANDAVNI